MRRIVTSVVIAAGVGVLLAVVDLRFIAAGVLLGALYLALTSAPAVERWPPLGKIPFAEVPDRRPPPVDPLPEGVRRVGILNEDGGESYSEDSKFGEDLDVHIYNRRGGKSGDKGTDFE